MRLAVRPPASERFRSARKGPGRDSALQRRWLLADRNPFRDLGRIGRKVWPGFRTAASANGIGALARGSGLAGRCNSDCRQRQLVTDKLEPNDVDCVLLIGPDFPRDGRGGGRVARWLAVSLIGTSGGSRFRQYTERTFATDRNLVSKGMVEVAP